MPAHAPRQHASPAHAACRPMHLYFCAARGPAKVQCCICLADRLDSGVATRVAKSGRNLGRASERCVGKRPQCGEQDMTRAVGPATGRVTTCHGDHGRHGAGHVQRRVTAPGHGGHGAGHGIHGAGHGDHGDGGRPAGPESAAASAVEATAFTGRAGETKKQGITSSCQTESSASYPCFTWGGRSGRSGRRWTQLVGIPGVDAARRSALYNLHIESQSR